MERDRLMNKEERFRTAVRAARVRDVLAGAAVAVCGALRQNSYSLINALCTFLLVPALWAARRLLRWEGGWQIELFVYAFACLGWTLGGAAECYETIPHFDKLVHMLSGVFVSMLALALFRMLERERPIAAQGKATACLFVLFASMAVAGMFELCEYAKHDFLTDAANAFALQNGARMA